MAVLHTLSPRDDEPVFTESNATRLLIIESTLISLVFAVVGLRCWCRHYLLRAFQLDDAFMIVALALAVTGYACFVKFVQWGGGKHFAEIPADWHEQLAFWAFIQSPIDNTGISTVKISIAFFLRRFVKGKKTSWFLNAMIAFCVLFIVATILTFVLACEPMEAVWKPVEGSTCWSAKILSDVGIANGVISIMTDIVFVAVPVHVIKGLQVNKRTRWSLIAIMSLGLFVPVATTARMVYGYLQASEADWTYNPSLYLWLNLEVQMAILVISLPTLRPLFHTVLRGNSARTGQYYKNEYRAPTGASRAYTAGTGTNQRSQPRRSKYERHQDIPLGDWQRMHDDAYSAKVVSTHNHTRDPTNSKVSAERGSEDEILPPAKGIQIMKTTEVTVL